MEFLYNLVPVLFVFAFGACVGSLINVLVYRLPRGLNVVTPPSACPSCGTRLSWRENFPIFGWLCLRGRCRYCDSKISAEYPIVELFVALLWVVLWLVLYGPDTFLGIPFHEIRPQWAWSKFGTTWPIFLCWLTLFSCLVAMTLIDARTFQIPMVLTWVPLGVAILAHVGLAIYFQYSQKGRLPVSIWTWSWVIASPDEHGWMWIGGAIGGCVGVMLSNIFLATGLVTRSFADYEEWERKALAEQAAAQPQPAPVTPGSGAPPQPPAESPDNPAELWIQYPHARREMARELIFLSPIVGLALTGAGLAYKLAGPWKYSALHAGMIPGVDAPLWLQVLAGVLMGYLIGGGIVWGVRVFGSIAFGKEAMGLGDVHLMGAVGACLGWTHAALGFLGATIVGLVWAILGRLIAGSFRRALPFGPYLAVATFLVLMCRPLIERLLRHLVPAWESMSLP